MTEPIARTDGPLLDLDGETRRALEFDDLLEWIAGLARTRLGAARIRGLSPLADAERVGRELEAVSEVGRYLAREGMLLPAALPDPSPALEGLAVASLRLEAGSLRDLAALGAATADLRAHLLVLEADAYPLLQQAGSRLPDLRQESRAVLEGIGPEGRLEDTASPELGRIRHAMGRTGSRLKQMLRDILRDPDAEPVIQDDFITQRGGRYVIPVRTDAPRPLRGIVHASSSSGATRFIEPIESVELNNELVRLAEQERDECERILLAWTEAFRDRRPDVEAMVQSVSRLDDLQARALFARETDAVAPRVARDGPLQLGAVRHPLLLRHLVATREKLIPLNLTLDPAHQVLVISGPNTGGKTVALKTLGLAVLMAQSGIPVPASHVRLPLYRQVRADIGDHQSIEADLSTYSAHIRAIVGILNAAAAPALFLFDEMGTGTEPTEGAALAQSILDTLDREGITAVATTHLAPLKAWALERERAMSAAMEFDTASLRPTYRLLAGAPGTSAGLEIAERLGLDPEIVRRARARLDPQARQGEIYVRRLRDLLARSESEREELLRARASLEDERRALAERHERELAKLQRESRRALDEAVRELRDLGRQELEAVVERRERARLDKQWARSEARLEAHADRSRSALGASPDGSAGWLLPEVVRPGLHVRIETLGREGTVEAVRGSRADVRLGEMTFTVDVADIRVRKGGDAPEPARPRPVRRGGAERLSRPAPRELKLLGRTVEEALAEVDRFLDAALVAGHEEIRVVHGHGTGRLRSAVRRFLDGHAQVARHRPGSREEGGDGATVVTLR